MDYDERLLLPLVVPNPAIGTDWSYKLPAGAIYHIFSVNFTLVTSAGVANRQPGIQALFGGVVLFKSSTNAQQTATQTIIYAAARGAPIQTLVGGVQSLFLQNDFVLRGESILQSSTGNIQAADQYSAITIYAYVESTSDDYNLGS